MPKGFGNYTLSFKGDDTTLDGLFGDKPLAPSQMTKKLWDYINAKRWKAQAKVVPKVGDKVNFKHTVNGKTGRHNGVITKVVKKGKDRIYLVKHDGEELRFGRVHLLVKNRTA